jgi:hypothetical protein
MLDVAGWQFRRMQAGEMNIDPIEAEFFSTDALGSLTDALVREAIQNSLDARQRQSAARIRITFPAPERLLKGDRRDYYLAGLKPHLTADRSGLVQPPSPDEPLSFLVFEDFGTRGLQGDPAQSEDEEIGASSIRNDFYYFWRNIGRSRKQSSELGRWGLGKTVFPASSRINSFFALTVRQEDGRRLLMGQSVLRIHKLEGVRYYPYGYFGRFQNEFALPIDAETILDEFCSAFAISRTAEPGLSVVIPYPDSELEPATMLPSIVHHYFVPILAGDLIVELVHDGKHEVLDAVSLQRLLGKASWDEGHQLQQLAELAHWGLRVSDDQRVRLTPQSAANAPRWSDDGLSESAVESLRERFNRGERIALNVPVWVKPVREAEALGSFDVYMERDDRLTSGEEHFVREGITVAGVRSGVQAGVRAIVFVRDRALSALLGDSENPAHTEWQERSIHFKERYRHGPFTLRYVKSAPREIVRMLTRPAAGRDFRLLQHIFSREIPTEESVRQHTRSLDRRAGSDGKSEPGAADIVGSDHFFYLQKLQGGFRVIGANDGSAMPPYAGIQVAYEVRRGNPFSLYQPLDFEIDKPPISVEAHGAHIVRLLRNLAVLRIANADFRLTVRGFDARRDVRVKVVAMGEDVPQ